MQAGLIEDLIVQVSHLKKYVEGPICHAWTKLVGGALIIIANENRLDPTMNLVLIKKNIHLLSTI